MILQMQDKLVEVEYIRVYRDAANIAFHALVNGEWVYFPKCGDKRVPTYHQMDWPNPSHMYGWSKPYRIQK